MADAKLQVPASDVHSASQSQFAVPRLHSADIRYRASSHLKAA